MGSFGLCRLFIRLPRTVLFGQVPLNVMEDRLLGSVDVEESVKQVNRVAQLSLHTWRIRLFIHCYYRDNATTRRLVTPRIAQTSFGRKRCVSWA